MSRHLPFSIYLKSAAVFLLILLLGAWINYVHSQQYIEEQKTVALQVATAEVGALSQNLNASISLVYTLETLLRERGFAIDQESLERFAPQLRKQHSAVSSLQYAPDGIVSFVDPLAGNEKAVGHNLLVDKKRNKEAFDSVEKRTLTLAGPFELLQGGVAVVARLPIFRSAGTQDDFWGFSTVLIRIDDLLNSTTLGELKSKGYEWTLHRIHPDNNSPHVFYGTSDELLADSVHLTMNVPNAQWFISVQPVAGWLAGLSTHIIREAFFWLFLAGVFSYFAFFFQKQPIYLKKQIELGTAELREAKNVLEVSENRLAQVAENEEMWIWEVDAEGLYTYCSPTCEKIFGYPASEIVGQKYFYDFFDPDDREKLKKAAFAVFKKKKSFIKFVNRNIDRSGNYVWLSTSGVPLLDNDGNLTGYRGADVNITAQVVAEESRKRMETQAIRTSQLATLGELSAGVAHEINNPINGVINYAQIILDKSGSEPNQEDLARRIIQEGERIAAIVSKLLSFSRKEDAEHRWHDVRSLIDTPLTLISKKLAHDGIIVDVDIDEGVNQVKCNGQQIEQVFLNLLTNAQYALNKKNPQRAENKRIQLQAARVVREDNPFVSLEIKDFGIGIPEEILSEIFTPFYTTKEIGVGTGLGLCISEDIMKIHNGSISIESLEGEYTKVTISLPA
jgi:PAS domain S-box-containing protein